MLTENKEITTPEYWRKIYQGERNNAKTDASNFKRPANAFDRFQWLADQVEGPMVLDVASGHATTMKRLRSMHPDWIIICSDQTEAAKKAANFEPYEILSAYDLEFMSNMFQSVTCSQAIEYMEFPDKFIEEAKRVADYFICTIPIGEMKLWSQLRIYTPESIKEWLSNYGEIVHFDEQPGIALVKLKFK